MLLHVKYGQKDFHNGWKVISFRGSSSFEGGDQKYSF